MTPKIFLSHAAADAALAEFVEQTITGLETNATVFRTTRPDQLPSGESWFRTIEENLRSSSAYLVLLTATSKERPWILFETGAAWYSDRPLVPVLAGIRREQLDEPLRLLQLLDLERPEDVPVVFSRLGIPAPDAGVFANAVHALASALRSGRKAKPEWDEVTIGGNRYVWGGPTHLLPDGQGLPARQEVIEILNKDGLTFRSDFADDPDGVEASQGFVPLYYVDRWDAKHLLYTEHGQVLYVKVPE